MGSQSGGLLKGPMGQDLFHHQGKPTRPRQSHSGADAGSAIGVDIRGGRAGHDARAHKEEGPALPILRCRRVAERGEPDRLGSRPRHRAQNEWALEGFKKTSPPVWQRSAKPWPPIQP